MTEFQQIISDWFLINQRDLPWRKTKNPYFIWLSEVILQQTRVAQGIAYYEKFVTHYPTIQHLSQASEQEILADWQGLGYYSRARNLHSAAKQICQQYNGVFPKTFEEIKNLKGIGDYTASAIASFAFDLPHAVVDGNVYRVLSRIYDVEIAIDSSSGKKVFQQLANDLLDLKNPALHNQSIMEFGALQCVPSKPDCSKCPLVIYCLSYRNNKVLDRPVKKGKIKIRNRYFLYLISFNKSNQTLLLRKRIEKDIWQNLYEFPKIEFEDKQKLEEYLFEQKSKFNVLITWQKHILSHQNIHATFAFTKTNTTLPVDDYVSAKLTGLSDFPLPRLIDRFLEHHSGFF